VDLPGIIQDGAMKETINNMIHSYISKETSLIILCHECNKDNECVAAYNMAAQVDPEQKRTIKIYTKCDSFESDERKRKVK
jgi:GTP-binding protein EngB required for normal cell division